MPQVPDWLPNIIRLLLRPLRLVYPSTLLFFFIIIIYAIGVEISLLNPVELYLRTLPVPRATITVLLYLFIIISLTSIYYIFELQYSAFWLEDMTVRRGGVYLLDWLILILTPLSLLGIWRFLDFFDVNTIILGSITFTTAIISLTHPRRFYVVQRKFADSPPDTIEDILTGLNESGFDISHEDLQMLNPDLDLNNLVVGDEIRIPYD